MKKFKSRLSSFYKVKRGSMRVSSTEQERDSGRQAQSTYGLPVETWTTIFAMCASVDPESLLRLLRVCKLFRLLAYGMMQCSLYAYECHGNSLLGSLLRIPKPRYWDLRFSIETRQTGFTPNVSLRYLSVPVPQSKPCPSYLVEINRDSGSRQLCGVRASRSLCMQILPGVKSLKIHGVRYSSDIPHLISHLPSLTDLALSNIRKAEHVKVEPLPVLPSCLLSLSLVELVWDLDEDVQCFGPLIGAICVNGVQKLSIAVRHQLVKWLCFLEPLLALDSLSYLNLDAIVDHDVPESVVCRFLRKQANILQFSCLVTGPFARALLKTCRADELLPRLQHFAGRVEDASFVTQKSIESIALYTNPGEYCFEDTENIIVCLSGSRRPELRKLSLSLNSLDGVQAVRLFSSAPHLEDVTISIRCNVEPCRCELDEVWQSIRYLEVCRRLSILHRNPRVVFYAEEMALMVELGKRCPTLQSIQRESFVEWIKVAPGEWQAFGRSNERVHPPRFWYWGAGG